jgi:DNA polymerase-3 subunit gamma/tau
MRDALSALDQVLAFTSERVTAADVSTVLGLIGRDLQFDIAETVAREDLLQAFALAGTVTDGGFDLRIVCRELARLMRDLMVIRIDPTRLTDPEIAAEGEQERLKALAQVYSREDLMRAFDLLSKSEYEIRQSSQPRHHFEMTVVKWIHLRQLTPLSEVIAGLERPGGAAPSPGAVPRGPRGPVPAPTAASARPTSASAPAPAGPRPSPAASVTTYAQSAAPPRSASPSASKASQSASSAPGAKTSPSSSQPQPSAAAAKPAPSMAPADIKAAVLSTIREQNKVFYGMVIGQAQKVELEGDVLTFTFIPVHKTLRAQLEGKRTWIEGLAHAASGRKITVVVREAEAAPVEKTAADEQAASRRADLTARAKAEPAVQAVLDVFGGEIEDVEEMN